MPLEDGEWIDPDPDDLPADEPPAAVTATLPRDPSTVTAPEDQDPESHRKSGEDENGTQAETKEPLPEFDPKVREDFEGLLYLGRLTHTFTYVGHSFTLRTLTTGEVLEVGLLHKPYVGTLSDVKAYQAALVAACVVDVDGQPLPMPITNDKMDTALLNKFRYVLRSWFPPLLDKVYEEYLLLEDRVTQVLAAMGNPSR